MLFRSAERVGSDWIISEGLKPGDRVVAEGLMKVRPGMIVDPRPYEGAKAPKTGQTTTAPDSTRVGSR